MQTVIDDSYWAYYQKFKAQCAEQGHIDQHCDKIFKEIQHATTNTCGILNFPFYMGLVQARSQQHHILINAHKLFKATTSCTLAYDCIFGRCENFSPCDINREA